MNPERSRRQWPGRWASASRATEARPAVRTAAAGTGRRWAGSWRRQWRSGAGRGGRAGWCRRGSRTRRQPKRGEPAARQKAGSGAAAEGGAGPEAAAKGAADGGGGGAEGQARGRHRRRSSGVKSAGADGGLEALATGDIALIDENSPSTSAGARPRRWSVPRAARGAPGSSSTRRGSRRAGRGWAMARAFMGAARRRRQPGPSRSVPGGWSRVLPGQRWRAFRCRPSARVIKRVFSAYDLATRDWPPARPSAASAKAGSIYEQLANSIAAVSEIIGIATAVLNVIAGAIGAISIAMWVITVLTVGWPRRLPRRCPRSPWRSAYRDDGARRHQRAGAATPGDPVPGLHLHQPGRPTDVEQQGGRIAAAAGPARVSSAAWLAGWPAAEPPRPGRAASASAMRRRGMYPMSNRPRGGRRGADHHRRSRRRPSRPACWAATGRRCCRLSRLRRALASESRGAGGRSAWPHDAGSCAGGPARTDHACTLRRVDPHAPTMPAPAASRPRCRPPPGDPMHRPCRCLRWSTRMRHCLAAAGRRHAEIPGPLRVPEFEPCPTTALSCLAGIPMRPAPTRRPAAAGTGGGADAVTCADRARHAVAHPRNRQRLRSGLVHSRRAARHPHGGTGALIRMPHLPLPPGGGMPEIPVRRGCRSSSPALTTALSAALTGTRPEPSPMR